MEQDHKTLIVERPTGPRITAEEPKSIGQLVSVRAKNAAKSVAVTAATVSAATVAVLTRHKFATTIGASAVVAVATHLIVATMMMGIITNKPGGAAAYSGPGDVTSGATAWWGLRAYSAAYAAPGTNKWGQLCDHAGANCTDEVVNSSGNAVIGTHGSDNCAVLNTCIIAVLYDQSGASACSGACDLISLTGPQNPLLINNCTPSGKPCIAFDTSGATLLHSSNNLASALTQAFTGSAVGQRTTVVSFADMIGIHLTGAVQLGFDSSAGHALMFAGSVPGTPPVASDNAFHTLSAVFSGASSILNVDGSAGAALSAGASSLSGSLCIGQCSNGLTGDVTEAGWWAGDKSANFTTLCNNQRLYWGGLGGSC